MRTGLQRSAGFLLRRLMFGADAFKIFGKATSPRWDYWDLLRPTQYNTLYFIAPVPGAWIRGWRRLL
jgi:hypothetical protein